MHSCNEWANVVIKRAESEEEEENRAGQERDDNVRFAPLKPFSRGEHRRSIYSPRQTLMNHWIIA